MRKHAVALIVGAALSIWSSSAWALAYTISSSIAFSTGGVSGTINPVTSLTGTTICLAGVCTSSVAQDWLLVSVTLDPGSDPVDRIDMAASGVTTVVGIGHYSDPDETPTGSSSIPTTSLARFDYGFPNVSATNLQASESTDRLFVAFSPVGSLPGPGIFPVIPPGTASFMISEANSANDFSVTGSIVLVPEPGTLLLFAGGLVALGVTRRRVR